MKRMTGPSCALLTTEEFIACMDSGRTAGGGVPAKFMKYIEA